MLAEGDTLYFRHDRQNQARITAAGKTSICGFRWGQSTRWRGIYRVAPCNGWEHWYYEDERGALVVIDRLREQIRAQQAVVT